MKRGADGKEKPRVRRFVTAGPVPFPRALGARGRHSPGVLEKHGLNWKTVICIFDNIICTYMKASSGRLLIIFTSKETFMNLNRVDLIV